MGPSAVAHPDLAIVSLRRGRERCCSPSRTEAAFGEVYIRLKFDMLFFNICFHAIQVQYELHELCNNSKKIEDRKKGKPHCP